MKKIHPRINGMETVTSMLLLLVSALLISNVFTLLNTQHTNTASIIDLRTYQTRSLGETLVAYSNNSMESPYLGNFSDHQEFYVFFWDGSQMHTSNADKLLYGYPIEKVLRSTPDGLSAVIILGDTHGQTVSISGEYVTWSYVMTDGSIITVFLSLHADSINFEEASQ
jgi:hypothetical protein